MIVTGVSIERNISLWFTTYNYRQSPSLDGCVPEYFIEWFKTRHELHTFRGTRKYGEVDNNREIITMNTKSLTMTVEGSVETTKSHNRSV
ncbi:unnamed protein product [Fasciola hepatica]|uniref:Uncharacterized protein n=1 Tax=Fasciola hepatica TaxID=6192 RepID=A0ABC9HIF9_FASHE